MIALPPVDALLALYASIRATHTAVDWEKDIQVMEYGASAEWKSLCEAREIEGDTDLASSEPKTRRL